MKKHTRRLLFVLLILLLCGLAAIGGAAVWTSTPGYHLSTIGNELGISLPRNAALRYEDSHGSFGDGVTFAQADFPQELPNFWAAGSGTGKNWRPLPLPESMVHLLFGEDGDARMKSAKNATNGFYCFEDRFAKLYGASPSDAPNNYTFALYDSDCRTLYFYRYDS